MRIGIDASCWASDRGYGRFARELTDAMTAAAPEHRFVCVGDQRAFDAWTPASPNVERVVVDIGAARSPTIAARADGNRSVRDMLRFTKAVRNAAVDVFFSPSVYSYFPLPARLRAVVTVHDTIAERFPELTLPSRKARLFWRFKVGLALRQARLVLTVSQYSARSITAVLGVAKDRIRVAVEAPSNAYHPSDKAAIREAATRAGIPEGAGWFVYVGGFNPHKRIDTIIEAHAAVARGADNPPHLVLIGKLDGDAFYTQHERLRELLRTLGTESLVHWTGFLPDVEVAPLVSGAVAALLPSEAEGFGLPAVEAAACGTPVIATTESPLPELLEGGGYFVHPGDTAAIERAMRELSGNRAARDAMGRRARERASALSWEQCATAALGAIYEAAA